jgi:hypothetical protein
LIGDRAHRESRNVRAVGGLYDVDTYAALRDKCVGFISHSVGVRSDIIWHHWEAAVGSPSGMPSVRLRLVPVLVGEAKAVAGALLDLDPDNFVRMTYRLHIEGLRLKVIQVSGISVYCEEGQSVGHKTAWDFDVLLAATTCQRMRSFYVPEFAWL